MKMMASTKTRTSAITRAITQGSAALSVPITLAPATGPANDPTPPTMTATKPWIKKADAEIGEQRKHRNDQRAGETGERRTERKSDAVDHAGGNAGRARQRRVFQ
jgi:hypothetical protein